MSTYIIYRVLVVYIFVNISIVSVLGTRNTAEAILEKLGLSTNCADGKFPDYLKEMRDSLSVENILAKTKFNTEMSKKNQISIDRYDYKTSTPVGKPKTAIKFSQKFKDRYLAKRKDKCKLMEAQETLKKEVKTKMTKGVTNCTFSPESIFTL